MVEKLVFYIFEGFGVIQNFMPPAFHTVFLIYFLCHCGNIFAIDTVTLQFP
jgi:hypothetical protein